MQIRCELKTLFDICVCTCFRKSFRSLNFESLSRSMCHCDLKIPLREWTFYADQIKARTMIIGPNLDLNTTKTIRQQEIKNVARIHMEALELERIRQGTQNEPNKSILSFIKTKIQWTSAIRAHKMNSRALTLS